MLTNPDLEHLRRVGSPLRIAQTLAPHLYGPNATYRADPWLMMCEDRIMDAILDRDNQRFLKVNAPAQAGKLLALTTPLPTPTGWMEMRDVRVGDTVLGADGRPCRVTAVSETEWRPPHVITFSDHSTITAGPEHQWTTFDSQTLATYTGRRIPRRGERALHTEHDSQWWQWESPGGTGPRVRTTEEILATLTTNSDKSNHSIPHAAPLRLLERELPVDPWLFGYWCGNGSRTTPTITSGSHRGLLDHEFVEERLDKAGVDWVLRERRPGSSSYYIRGLVTTLRELGCLGTKAVPGAYLRGSIEQRKAFLAGLMDSDGFIGGTPGTVEFDSMDQHLVDVVYELFVSLGTHAYRKTRRAKLNGKDYGVCYRVHANPPFNPFTLPRKAALWQPGTETGRAISRHHRYIAGIEIGDELVAMRCISVDGPGNLYLAGEQMVPTHNSSLVEIFTPLWVLGHWPDTRIILIAYSDDLAIRSGALVRDIFMRWGPEFFGQTVDANYESKQEWRIAGHQGGMLSVGIGSRISGMPSDLLVIGDVIKGMEEAASAKTKETHWNEFHGAILPRLQPGGTMLLGATRFADDDLSGRIDTQAADPEYDGDRWESLVFKAIAEPDFNEEDPDDPEWRDLLGRRRGEPLKTRFSKGEEEDEERWKDSFFYKRKRTLIPFVFSVVYQQEPTTPTGGMFPPDKWTWFDPDEMPHMVGQRRAWDLAASEGGGDWSVGGFVTKDYDGNFYVQRLARFQKGPDGVMDEVRLHATIDGVAVPIKIEASRNGDGLTVVAFYAKELKNYTVTAANADGSKEERARPYSTLMQQGRVKLPKFKNGQSPEWVAPFIDEHRKMMGDGRKGRHDDQIDVVAHAINDMLDSSMVEMLIPDLVLLNQRGRSAGFFDGASVVPTDMALDV